MSEHDWYMHWSHALGHSMRMFSFIFVMASFMVILMYSCSLVLFFEGRRQRWWSTLPWYFRILIVGLCILQLVTCLGLLGCFPTTLHGWRGNEEIDYAIMTLRGR